MTKTLAKVTDVKEAIEVLEDRGYEVESLFGNIIEITSRERDSDFPNIYYPLRVYLGINCVALYDIGMLETLKKEVV